MMSCGPQVQGEDRAVKVELSEEEGASSDGDMSKPESVKENKTPLPAAAAVLSVDEEFRARRREEKKRCSHLPEHYRGYEALMVEDDDLMTGAVPTDMDVYRCTRALQQALQDPMRTGTSTDHTTRGYLGKVVSRRQHTHTHTHTVTHLHYNVPLVLCVCYHTGKQSGICCSC